MNTEQAVQKLTEVIRRKHFALSTEHSYCAWLKRYCNYVRKLPVELSSEQKLERFLTALAKDDVAASTQNQALNAIIFFYKEAMSVELKNIEALRARRPNQVRRAPTREAEREERKTSNIQHSTSNIERRGGWRHPRRACSGQCYLSSLGAAHAVNPA